MESVRSSVHEVPGGCLESEVNWKRKLMAKCDILFGERRRCWMGRAQACERGIRIVGGSDLAEFVKC